MRWRGDVGLADPATGANMPVEAIAGKIVSDKGDVTAVVTILHDRREALENERLYGELKRASEELEAKVQLATSELIKQNELLRRQAIELEQASALKSQFLANMSHEFRTPLNAILGYTSMLLEGMGGALPPAQKKSMMRVDSNARHLLSIINDILDISRIEAGRMPLHLSTFQVHELVKEVMAELEPLTFSRPSLKVTSAVAQRLPQLYSDRAKVKQIVLNLLSNALKFTSKGSVIVKATHHKASDRISVAVRDTGIGIPEKDRAAVFEDFRQVDNSPTREYGGTGLGLSICRRLAKMLGGEIALESAVGKGSTFALVLPRRLRRAR
jgi:signal transduction histidine kinase